MTALELAADRDSAAAAPPAQLGVLRGRGAPSSAVARFGSGLVLALAYTAPGALVVMGAFAALAVAPGLGGGATVWPGSWTEGTLRAIWLVASHAAGGIVPSADTAAVFAPIGADLSEICDGDRLPYALAGLFARIAGLHAGYAIAVGAILLANGAACYRLASRVVTCPPAAAAAGALAALHPGVLERVANGDLPAGLVAVPAMALGSAFDLRRHGGVKNALVAGVWISLSYATCWQSALLVIPAALGVALMSRRAWRGRHLLHVAVAVGTVGLGSATLHAAGLGMGAALWAPGPPVLGGAGLDVLLRYLQGAGQGYVDHGLFAGDAWTVLPLAPAALGLAAGWRGARAWVALLVVVVLAAGPAVDIGGGIVPLPGLALLRRIPVLARVAEPSRWAVLAILPASALAALGITSLIQVRGSRPDRRAAWALALAVLAPASAAAAGRLPLDRILIEQSGPRMFEGARAMNLLVLPGSPATGSLAFAIANPGVAIVSGPARSWLQQAPRPWLAVVEGNEVLAWGAAGGPIPRHSTAVTDAAELPDLGVEGIVIDGSVLEDGSMATAEELQARVAGWLGRPIFRGGTLRVFSLHEERKQ